MLAAPHDRLLVPSGCALDLRLDRTTFAVSEHFILIAAHDDHDMAARTLDSESLIDWREFEQ